MILLIINDNFKKNYQAFNKTFSFTKANILGIIFAIPVLILGPFIYGSVQKNISNSNIIIMGIGFVAGIFIHEFIHGFTWHLFCKEKWKSIKFGIDKKSFCPYTTCTEILSINSYRLGAVMPLIITGVLPYIIGILINNSNMVYIGTIMIACAVGDLLILLTIVTEKSSSLCSDHPTSCGCVVYRKIN